MSEYRLKVGHVDAATIIADAGSVVSDFPNTGLVNPWVVASNGVVSTYTARTSTPSGKDYGTGLPSTSWLFSALNREQVEYLLDTFLGGLLVAPVTIMTYRFNNQSAAGDARNWVVLQALMRVQSGQTPDNTDGVNDLWYRDFRIDFIRGAFQDLP